MIRILLGMIVVLAALCAAFGGLLWHERTQAGRQDCEIATAARVNADTLSTASAQHRADMEQVQELQSQIAQLQSDANAAAHLKAVLESKLAKQTEVLRHVRETDAQARRCLDTGVPASLLDSLRAATGGQAGQTDQGGGIQAPPDFR